MKTTLIFLLTFVTTASAAVSLQINDTPYDSIILRTGQAVTVQVVSDDASIYSAYVGFDDAMSILGTFNPGQPLSEAGNQASVSTAFPPPVEGFFVHAAGTSPPPSAGIHFVFAYTTTTVGQTTLYLYDSDGTTVLDTIDITVESGELGDAFTYQGRLLDDNIAADGFYDMQFKLFDAPTEGIQLGPTNDANNFEIIDGYFIIRLDFGSDVFDYEGRWLQIAVRPQGSMDPYTILSPRQRITPSPYTIETVDRIEQLEAENTQLQSRVTQLESSVAQLESSVTQLEELFAGVTRNAGTIRFSGVNVQIVNGAGSTDTTNYVGNLIVGYNEDDGDVHSGSHNIVVGKWHTYSSYGGLVTAFNNSITAPYACVSGGQENTASGDCSSVSGGYLNYAPGWRSSVLGGVSNTTDGTQSSISGGSGNTTEGTDSSVSGGIGNTASGVYSSVSGGQDNTASQAYASISSGRYNIASGFYSSVSGGEGNTASGFGSTVSGGLNRSVSSDWDWRAGTLFEDD